MSYDTGTTRPGKRSTAKPRIEPRPGPLSRQTSLPLGQQGGQSVWNAAVSCAECLFVCWLVACLTSQQHASVSQGRICTDNFTCCYTEIEVADQTFDLTQSRYTDTEPTSPSADPITPGAWQGSHWSVHFEVTGMIRPRKIPAQAGFEPRIFHSRGGRLSHSPSEAVLQSVTWGCWGRCL